MSSVQLSTQRGINCPTVLEGRDCPYSHPHVVFRTDAIGGNHLNHLWKDYKEGDGMAHGAIGREASENQRFSEIMDADDDRSPVDTSNLSTYEQSILKNPHLFAKEYPKLAIG